MHLSPSIQRKTTGSHHPVKPWRTLAPLFVPAALVLSAIAVLTAFLAPYGTNADSEWVADFRAAFPSLKELEQPAEFARVTSAKLVWLVTGAALTTVAVGLGSVALVAARRVAVDICGVSSRAFWVCAAMILAVGLSVGAVKDIQGYYWFEHIVTRAHAIETLVGSAGQSYGMRVGTFTAVAYIALGLACMAVMILAGTLLLRGRASDRFALPEQVRQLDLIPYLGAPILVLGVAEVLALYRYAAMATRSPEEALVISRAVSGSVGIAFSVVLATAYVAPWIALRLRVDESYRNDVSQDPLLIGKRDEWLKEHGFSESAWTGMARILALLGPALTSSVIESVPGVFR